MLAFQRRTLLVLIAVGTVVLCFVTILSMHTTTPAPSKLRQLSAYLFSSTAATPSQYCPSPHDTKSPPIDHSQQTCQPLPSIDPEFALELCHDTRICNAFTFNVWRADEEACRTAEAHEDPSLEPRLNSWIRKTRGPEAFLIRTDGAQRYASTWSDYHGNCSYSFDVQLKNAGHVFLQAWHTFSRYEAFSETNSSWPEMMLKPLFSSPVVLSICQDACKEALADLAEPDKKMLSYPEAAPQISLPECSGPGPVHGAYIPVNPLDLMYPPASIPLAPNGEQMAGRWKFVPEDCRWTHAGLRYRNPKPCTEGKKSLLFLGDSHGRVLFDTMAHRLQGIKAWLDESEKQGEKEYKIGNLDMKLLWDPRGKEFWGRHQCDLLEGIDVLVLSVASHWAGDTTTFEFTNVLEAIFGLVKSCPINPSTLIYIGPPAQPPRQDHWIQEYKDHRTNVRLHHWNDLGMKLALENGWQVLDQYHYTIPHHMEVLHTDMAHYLVTDAIDPMLDELIAKTGICPPPDI